MAFIMVLEAKEMFCPFGPTGPGYAGDSCLGEKCMSWRWQGGFIPRDVVKVKYERPIYDETWTKPIESEWTIDPRTGEDITVVGLEAYPGDGYNWSEDDHCWVKVMPEKRRGYCGLAGKPACD